MQSIAATPRKPVLLVEDNVDDAFLFSRALHALGKEWDFFSVPDVESATRYLNAAAADDNCRPAAVFVDLKLGHRDGGELISWIRNKPHLQGCSVFALSGIIDESTDARARLQGADDCLVKPVSGSALAFTLTRYV